jgi:hypothetical protein
MQLYAWTKYYGPTNSTGSRIRVTFRKKMKATIPFEYAARDAHEAAVKTAMEQWGYTVKNIEYACETPDGSGGVYSITAHVKTRG